MEVQGKIILALPVKTGTSARGEWKVQEFVVETLDGQFSRKMVFSVFGEDRLQRFNIQVGQDVTVSFDIDAHEYNGRWFNSIRAFDVRQIVNQPAAGMQPPVGTQPFEMPQPANPAPYGMQQPAAQVPPTAPPAPQPDPFPANSTDDLPF